MYSNKLIISINIRRGRDGRASDTLLLSHTLTEYLILLVSARASDSCHSDADIHPNQGLLLYIRLAMDSSGNQW